MSPPVTPPELRPAGVLKAAIRDELRKFDNLSEVTYNKSYAKGAADCAQAIWRIVQAADR